MSARPSWDDYFLGFATAAAARADCTRSQVGAVIAMGHELIQPGYNGAPPGKPGCKSAGACPRGRHYDTGQRHELLRVPLCACGRTWPCDEAAQPGVSAYDAGTTRCIAVHAEVNAIIRAGRDRCVGATMYVTREPCEPCWSVIEAAGIMRVVWPEGERKTYWWDMPVDFRG